MSLSNAFETSILQHIFQNADIANIGDAAGLQNSVADGSLYVALHEADPGEAGDQTTSETDYTNYARVAVSRNGATGWTVSNNEVSNTAAVTFPAAGAHPATITHVSVGVAANGASVILWSGQLTAQLAVSAGITPQFAIGVLKFTID